MLRSEFERLALEHLDAVYRMAFKLTRNADEASDLVQETYLRALRSFKTYEERGSGMRPWLFTIAHNSFNSRRKREARGPVSVDSFFEEDGRERAPDAPPPAWDLASLDWEHVDGRLKRAIEAMREEHREVLLLWGVEGMKYREIAGILNVPIGTVMSRLHRARRALAEELGELAGELGFEAGAEGTAHA